MMTQRWCKSVIALLTMALVVYLVPGANAQGAWTNLAPLPLGGAEGMCVSGSGDIVVAAYGFNSGEGDGTHTRLYNMLTNSWTLGANAPGIGRSEVAYGNTSAGGNVYCIGGRPTFLVGNELQRYNITTNSWTTLAPLPGAGRAAAAAAVVGSSIYVIGGRTGDSPCSGGYLNEVLRYDIPSDTWFPLAPLPSPRSDFGAAAVGAAGGNIYVFGGCNSSGVLADVDVYNVQTNTWSTAPADMPTARATIIVGQVGNQVFAIGGFGSGFVPTPVNEAYNVAKDTWSPASTVGMVPRGETGAYSHAGRLVVPGGGQPAFGTPSDANQSFQPQ